MTVTTAESGPTDLSTLTKPQLKEVADKFGIPISMSWDKPTLIRSVEEGLPAEVKVSPNPLALKTKNVAVVGFSEGHIKEAPFGDNDWELWGINRLHTVDDAKEQTFDRWFNLHDLEKFHGEDKEHLDFLVGFQGPVYLRPQDVGKYPIPNAVPFPWEEMVARFGRYFNNTISWLLAYGIVLEPKQMGIYGVDMAQDAILNAEYSQQRPSCEFFIGVASGMGIPVHLPSGSDLLKSTHLYGFEDADPLTEKLMSRMAEVGQRKEQAKAHLATLQAQTLEVTAAINQLDGAMQDQQYLIRNWVPQPPGDRISPNGKAE